MRRRDYFASVFTFYVIVLEIKHIYKSFVAHDVLQDISLRLPPGPFPISRTDLPAKETALSISRNRTLLYL